MLKIGILLLLRSQLQVNLTQLYQSTEWNRVTAQHAPDPQTEENMTSPFTPAERQPAQMSLRDLLRTRQTCMMAPASPQTAHARSQHTGSH